jgi:AcrR family transcriptional regulator
MSVEDATTTCGDLRVDGRRARRDRGREAVTEATIDLVLEGHVPPSAEQVAARAGVSVASLFRYFETLDDLRRATIQRYQERIAHLTELADIGQGPLAARLDSYVASRLRLYQTTEPMAGLARSRAVTVPDIDDSLHRARATAAEQIRRHFGTELAVLTPARRDDLVALIATTTSFESWLQLRDDYARNSSQTRRAWINALERLLTAP